jgi:hypothetical protein
MWKHIMSLVMIHENYVFWTPNKNEVGHKIKILKLCTIVFSHINYDF